MKITVSTAINISQALQIAAQSNVKGKTNYAIAKNLNKIRPILEDFDCVNKIRIDSFSKKDADGSPLVNGQNVDFGDNLEDATKAYKELMEKEIDVDFYTVVESEEAYNIPANALVVLLDVIVLEQKTEKSDEKAN